MKIHRKNKKTRKRIVIALIAIALVAAGAGIAYAFIYNSRENNDDSINYDPPTQEQRQAGEAIKEESINSEDDTSRSEEQDSDERNVPIDITSANQNGDQLQIRTLVHTVDAGECALVLSGSDDQSRLLYSAPTQPFASSSSCQGFDVPISELSPGEWTIEVTYTSAQARGIATQTITIE